MNYLLNLCYFPIRNIKLPRRNFYLEVFSNNGSLLFFLSKPSVFSLVFQTLFFIVVSLMFLVILVSVLTIYATGSSIILFLVILANILLGMKVYYIISRLILWAKTTSNDVRFLTKEGKYENIRVSS